MYKVFIKNKPIILTEKPIGENHFLNLPISEFNEQVLNHLWTAHNVKGLLLQSTDLKRDWKHFKQYFKVAEGAGGKVYNSKRHVLFIERFDKWDLPKGHVEHGENKEAAALREVTEECAIKDLKIVKELPTTYHIHRKDKKWYLKVVQWFEMFNPSNETPRPHTEEGITKAIFKNKTEIQEALKNTYQTIRLLF